MPNIHPPHAAQVVLVRDNEMGTAMLLGSGRGARIGAGGSVGNSPIPAIAAHARGAPRNDDSADSSEEYQRL
jgi:hypothetical protein